MLEVEVGGSSSEACQVKCARPYLKNDKNNKNGWRHGSKSIALA
jgi:hypothetical protein